MRLGVLSAVVVAGLVSFALRHEATAAFVAPHPPSASAGGPIENIYYYHGRYYRYHYHGRYYARRSYRYGHWRYY